MKKLSYLLVCALVVFAFTDCKKTKKTSTPGAAAMEYADHLKKGNYEVFADYIIIDEVPVEQAPVIKKEYATALREKHQPVAEQNGGVKDVKVVSENVASDGKTANVVLEHTYNNGQKENVEYLMALDELDMWRFKTIGEEKQVWKVTLADGSHGTVKLKENPHRDILKEHIDGEGREFVKEIDRENRDIVKVKDETGEKEVIKVIDKGDEEKIKVKVDGEKETVTVPVR